MQEMSLEDKTVDGIIFSPPYSFAIDYLHNDAFHLNYLGVETESLRNSMIGLRGKKLSEKFELYQEDMEKGPLGMYPSFASRKDLHHYRGDQQQPVGKGLGHKSQGCSGNTRNFDPDGGKTWA